MNRMDWWKVVWAGFIVGLFFGILFIDPSFLRHHPVHRDMYEASLDVYAFVVLVSAGSSSGAFFCVLALEKAGAIVVEDDAREAVEEDDDDVDVLPE